MKPIYFALILCSPFFSWAEDSISYKSCVKKSFSHPNIIMCMRNEIYRIENNIKIYVKENKEIYTIPHDFYFTQRENIKKICFIYLNIGGERGEILETQCEIDKINELKYFIISYIQAVDNS